MGKCEEDVYEITKRGIVFATLPKRIGVAILKEIVVPILTNFSNKKREVICYLRL